MAQQLDAIQQDTVSFFGGYPPFDKLPVEELVKLVVYTELAFYKKGEAIFSQGTANTGFLYIVKKGDVSLLQGSVLIDRCDAGDIFGVRSSLSANNYLVAASANENSLVYRLSKEYFLGLLPQYPEFSSFFLSGLASGLPVLTNPEAQNAPNDTKANVLFGLSKINEVSIVESTKALVWCRADTQIQEAAVLMSDSGISSLVILDEQEYPIGIITDTDFRKKVVAKNLSVSLPVSEIMSSPVKTVGSFPSVSEVLLTFVKENCHHLCVTEDGTRRSKAIGVVSNHDVLLERGDHPGAILKEIRKAKITKELASIRQRFQTLIFDFLKQQVSIAFLSRVTTIINESIIERAIDLIINSLELDISTGDFVWFSLGSEGRQEQLLQTDIDNALLFDDTNRHIETERKKYLKLAKEVIAVLHEAGFALCPAEMMASNPKWCLGLSEWKVKFSNWIKVPTNESIMMGNIFFDYRRVVGSKKMTALLTRHIYNEIGEYEIFLNFMAKNALQNPPPLSFFRGFVVEKDGEHADQFDLKARAMMPLIDAGRLLALQHNLTGVNNTVERFTALAEQLPQYKELYQEAAEAFAFLLQMRATEGMQNGDSGRFVSIERISKLDKRILRNVFKTIDAVQSHIKQSYRTELF